MLSAFLRILDLSNTFLSKLYVLAQPLKFTIQNIFHARPPPADTQIFEFTRDSTVSLALRVPKVF